MEKPTDFLSDPEKARYVEESLKALSFTIPTEPGRYADKEGEIWELTAEGYWYDKDGVTKDPSWCYSDPGRWSQSRERRITSGEENYAQRQQRRI